MSERTFAFFRTGTGPLSDEAQANWRLVRDVAFPIPIVQGAKEPDWSMGTQLEEDEDLIRIYLIDGANREMYLLHELPFLIALLEGVVDANGTPNPKMQHVETTRRIASLN
jgi:hypothetical protein